MKEGQTHRKRAHTVFSTKISKTRSCKTPNRFIRSKDLHVKGKLPLMGMPRLSVGNDWSK